MFSTVCENIFLISIFIFSSNAFAINCNVKHEDIAREFVIQELSGQRAPEKSSCLDQSNFKTIFSSHEVDLNSKLEPIIVPKDADIKILSSTRNSADSEEFKVIFEIKFKDKSGKTQTHKDSLMFLLNSEKKAQEASGCANLLDPPAKRYLYENCK